MPLTRFATLRRLLLDLGFTQSEVPDSHVLFERGDPPTRILLPPFASDDPVDAGSLVIARRTLDERGILSREAFDRLLAERAVAV